MLIKGTPDISSSRINHTGDLCICKNLRWNELSQTNNTTLTHSCGLCSSIITTICSAAGSVLSFYTLHIVTALIWMIEFSTDMTSVMMWIVVWLLNTWMSVWRHAKKTLSALLAFYAGKPPVHDGFPSQRYFSLVLDWKKLWSWWSFQTSRGVSMHQVYQETPRGIISCVKFKVSLIGMPSLTNIL